MNLSADVAVVGAGIAGLWIARRLRSAGYSVVVVSDGPPGSGQTIASQGIVHSGLKYALGGSLNPASERIADMPEHWRACLAGEGDVDLRRVRVGSNRFHMMADASVTSRITAFFGGQLTAGRSERLKPSAYPAGLQHQDFGGTVFAMSDFVLDPVSLVAELALGQTILQGRADVLADDGVVTGLRTGSGASITAGHYVFAAGAGNEALVDSARLPFRTQRRPLCQVSVHAADLPPLFVHAVSLRSGSKPRVTITSHTDGNGALVWYLGGNLAETGTARTDAEQISHARAELRSLFPWIQSLTGATFRCHRIERSEPAADHQRPNEPACLTHNNVSACWPIKLTMAPMLAAQVLAALASLPRASAQPAAMDPMDVADPPWI